MRKRKYIYNTETYRYEEYRPGRALWWRKLGWATGFSCVLAAGFLCLNAFAWEDIHTQAQRKRQQVLGQQLMDSRLRLQQIDLELERIHSADQTYFRSILNLPRQPAETWESSAAQSPLVATGDQAAMHQALELSQRMRSKFGLQLKSMEQLAKAAEENRDELRHVPTLRPTRGHVLSGFGYRRDPIQGGVHFHPGLDFHGHFGDRIYAVADGTVITSGFSSGGYGLEVEIDHGFGYITKYAHMSKTKVQVGQQVKRRDLIGFIGNTGYSVGPHLHYEVIKHGVKVDPMDYVLSE
ncbi:MAG: M23 family metallopeptidase [Bacteroidetes bacterium]|nr:M23 family metallopeptidase [Bacteroidota bacterium]